MKKKLKAFFKNPSYVILATLMAYSMNKLKQYEFEPVDTNPSNWGKKIALSVGLDALDFIIGAGDLVNPYDIPILSIGGTLYDIIQVPIAIALWGKYGLISVAEIPMGTEVGNTIDGFFPALTIAGLMAKKNYT